MAQVTSQTFMPDLKHEYHTINVDTLGQASKNTFSVYIQQPLKNVVQARLVSAKINTSLVSNVCYVSIEELNTQFSQRATSDLEGQTNLLKLNNSFGSIMSANTLPLVFRDEYPIVHQYITPIKKVSRLTVSLLDQTGGTIPGEDLDNFLTLQFICRKPNLSGEVVTRRAK